MHRPFPETTDQFSNLSTIKSIHIMLEFDQLASNKVLTSPEIVENILLHSDLRTVLRAQKTCQTWNNAIQEFLSIQKHLFFKPTGDIDSERIPNPLLDQAFLSFFPQVRRKLSVRHLDIVRNLHKAEAYIREEASWRRIIVQQSASNGLALLQINIRCLEDSPEGPVYEVLVRPKSFVELHTSYLHSWRSARNSRI